MRGRRDQGRSRRWRGKWRWEVGADSSLYVRCMTADDACHIPAPPPVGERAAASGQPAPAAPSKEDGLTPMDLTSPCSLASTRAFQTSFLTSGPPMAECMR